MRIGLLSGSVSRRGGGVFEAVVAHSRLIAALGHEAVAIGIDDPDVAADRARFGTVPVLTARRLGPAGVGYAPGLLDTLLGAELDLLHLHGIWQFPSRSAAQWARRTGRPYLISPHGMLDPWIVGRGRLKKRLARIGYEEASWRRADLFHALTDAEARDIRGQTGRDRVAIVPNAVGPVPSATAGAAPGAPYLLYLSRIHPKKNVEALAEAWCAARQRTGAAQRLLICGWGDAGAVAGLQARLAALGDPSIEFLGAVFGARKDALIAGARFLVLPSFSEGLPMAILEAWAAGVPTLMSQGCNLAIGFAQGAARDTGTAVAEIAAVLADALAMREPEHAVMAAAARRLATTDFSPQRVAEEWGRLYARFAPGA